MGGFGSGRPGERTKTEDCWSLDVNRLHRDGCLLPGYRGGRRWGRKGRPGASLRLQCDNDELVLSYQLRSPLGDPEPIEYPVPLIWSPCRHGGARPYFLCPGGRNGRRCGRRVVKLYLNGRYFRCRHCHKLSYASQSEARHDRLIRRRNKLLASLNPRADQFDLEPPRPKGMWRKTYEARLTEIRRLEAEAEAAFMGSLGGGAPGVSVEDWFT